MSHRRFFWRAAVFLVTGACLLTSCSPLYLLRGGYEEARILWRRQSIPKLISDPATPQPERTKLELVLQAREFARDSLGLRVGGSFRTVATIDRDQIVHVVTAAERFRLAAYRWWFPIVGSVPYKGFFHRDDAIEEAKKLESRGYDTLIRTSAAFSTLGWFDDPLPRHVLQLEETALVNLVLHELLHSTTYLAGEAEFNESFANFVGHRGAIAFFAARGERDRQRQAEEEWRDALRYSDFLERLIARLQRAYDSGIGGEERQQLFGTAVEELKELGLSEEGLGRYPANNAVVLHERLYNDRLGLFERVWQSRQESVRASIAALILATSEGGDPYQQLQNLVTDPQPTAED